MAQEISQGNIWGRLGSALGKGIEETVPKELDRYRMNQGLQQLEKDAPNLNQQQYYTRALQIPGLVERPQAIQSLVENQKYQNRINAYGKLGNQLPASADLSSVRQSQIDDTLAKAGIIPKQQQGQGQPQGQTPNVSSQEQAPEIANRNPTNQEYLPKQPWTSQQRNARTNEYIQSQFTPDEARQLAADDEAREIASSQSLQQQDKYLTEKSEEARNELKRQLETKTQKKGEELFKDITGEMQINLERGMERDLVTNPNATVKSVANDWSNRGLNAAKAKNQFLALSSKTGYENLVNRGSTLDKLNSYSKIFKEAGSSEEYYNLLKSGEIKDEKGNPTGQFGLGMSSQGAATLAYEPTEGVSKYIKNYTPSIVKSVKNKDINPNSIGKFSRKAAIEIEHLIKEDDSLLAIARSLSEKDPNFNQQLFFNQLNNDLSRGNFNERQKREIAEGARGVVPTWGDIKILPWRAGTL